MADSSPRPEQTESVDSNVDDESENNCGVLVRIWQVITELNKESLTLVRSIICRSKNTNVFGEDTLTNSAKNKIKKELFKLNVGPPQSTEIISHMANTKLSSDNSKSFHLIINELGLQRAVKIYVIDQENLNDFMEAQFIPPNNYSVSFEIYSPLVRKKAMYEYNLDCISKGNHIIETYEIDESIKKLTELPFFASNSVFRNSLCKHLFKIIVEHESFGEIDFESELDALTLDIEHMKFPSLLACIILYNKGLFYHAYDKCARLIDIDNADTFEAIFMLKCALMSRMWATLEEVSLKFLTNASDIDYILHLQKFLFLSYAEQKKWSKAVDIGKEIPLLKFTANEQATLAKCCIENGETPKYIMEMLKTTGYYENLQALLYIKQRRYVDAIDLLDQSTNNSVSCLYIAMSYFELRRYFQSEEYIIKSIRINPRSADSFLFWGILQEKYKEDVRGAKILFEKAFQLNAYDHTIVKNLSDMYLRLGLRFENFILLDRASRYMVGHSWLHYRLGIHYIFHKKLPTAIKEFLLAISHDNKDVYSHERLAEAYYAMDRFAEAIESYRKVIELCPVEKKYWFVKIGNIHFILHEYDEAIEAYEQVLEGNPRHVLAVKGITESLLCVSEEKFDDELYEMARNTAQRAIDYLTYSLNNKNKFLGFWKILGEGILIIAKLPDNFCFVTVNFKKGLGRLGTLYLKTNMYKLAYYCFWRGQSILPCHLERSIERKIAKEIIQEEESADQFRYPIPSNDVHEEWVDDMLNDIASYSVESEDWL